MTTYEKSLQGHIQIASAIPGNLHPFGGNGAKWDLKGLENGLEMNGWEDFERGYDGTQGVCGNCEGFLCD